MQKLIWSNKFSLGNNEIDSEHKSLINIYNELVDLSGHNDDHEMFSDILSKLTDYSLVHFSGEEKYMEELSYPNLKEHKECHKQFTYKMAMYNAKFTAGNPPDPKEIIRFIDQWLVNHILEMDM